MDALSLLLLVLTSVVDNVSSDVFHDKLIRNADLHPKSLDSSKLSGRWYKWMDTAGNPFQSTYLDSVHLQNGTSIKTLHQWFPDSKECRIQTVIHNPTSGTEASVKFQVNKRSTNETLGSVTILYFHDDPTEGILIMLRQKVSGERAYLVYTRLMDPNTLYRKVKVAIRALNLHLRDFNIKSRYHGCEKNEKGSKEPEIKL